MKKLSVIPFLAILSCAAEPPTRVRVELPASMKEMLTGIATDVALLAELSIVRCERASTGTFSASFATDASEVVFADVPACGAASLSLRLWATTVSDPAPAVLTFEATADTALVAGGEAVVTFSGPLLGELAATTDAAATCEIRRSGESAVTTTITLSEGATTRTPLARGDYQLTCEDASQRRTAANVSIAAGQRAPLALDFIVAPTGPLITSFAATNITFTTADLEWTVSTDSSDFNIFIELGYDSEFIESESADIGNLTSIPIEGLSPGTQYWARVTVTDSTGTSEPAIIDFTTGTIAPDDPPYVFDVHFDQIGTNFVAVSWSMLTNSTDYACTVQVSQTDDFANAMNFLVGTTTTSMINELMPNTTYYVRVYATDGFGTGAPSEASSFITNQALSSDALLSDLRVDGVMPTSFASDNLSAQHDIYGTMETVNIEVYTRHPGASVSLDGGGFVTGYASKTVTLTGDNTSVTIFVWAENAVDSASYTLTINRLPPLLLDVDFTGAAAVEPAFTLGDAGPYTVYVPTTTGQISLLPTCGGGCNTLAATVESTPVTLGTELVLYPTFGEDVVTITSIDPETKGEITYTFNMLRGPLTWLTLQEADNDDAINLTQSFMPSFGAYFGAEVTLAKDVETVATIDSRAVLFPSGVVALQPGTNNLEYEVRTPSGTLVDTYYVQLDAVRVITADYNPATDKLYGGYVRPLNIRMTNNFDIAVQGPPVTAFAQRPGTPYVYVAHGDNSTGVDGLGVMSASLAANTLSQRPRVASVSTADDYLTLVDAAFEPTSIVFHPILDLLYVWSKSGYVFAVPLDQAFVDGVELGQPGFPGTPEAQNLSAFNAGGDTRVLVSDDLSHLVLVALGPTTDQIKVLELDPSTGLASVENSPVALNATVAATDAALSHDGTFLLVSTAVGVQHFSVDTTTGVATYQSTDTAYSDVTQILRHPSLDVVYYVGNSRIHVRTYDSAQRTTTLLDANSHTGLDFNRVALDAHGRQIYYNGVFEGLPGTCAFGGGKLDATGAIGSDNGSNVACTSVIGVVTFD